MRFTSADDAFWMNPLRTVPFHMAVSTGLWEMIHDESKGDGLDRDGSEDSARLSYGFWSDVLARRAGAEQPMRLAPHYGLCLPCPPAPLLVHGLVRNIPITMACRPLEDDVWQVTHRRRSAVLHKNLFMRAFEDCMDRSCVACFHLSAPGSGTAPLCWR